MKNKEENQKLKVKVVKADIHSKSYNAFSALLEKHNKAASKKNTKIKAVSEALDFFSGLSILPHEFKSFDIQKTLNNVDDNVVKIKNQTIGYLKVFEKELLNKVNEIIKNKTTEPLPKSKISTDEMLFYLYDKNKILDDKLQIVLWLFLEFFKNSDLENETLNKIFSEYKERTKLIGKSKKE